MQRRWKYADAVRLAHSRLKFYCRQNVHVSAMLYLVMELAQGSLENHIAKGGLSADEIKNIICQ